MDFNFKKLANDATGFFNRAKQYTEETFLKAERTELDANFENLLQRADKTEEHTKRLLSALESYLQPNPTVRMEEVFYEKLELKKEGGRVSNLEHLGQAMTDAGNEFGSGTPYGNALLKVANAEFKLGTSEREFINASAASTLLPIRRFLEGDMKTIQKERKILSSKRLDLDAAKNRLKKAKTLETQASSHANIGLTIEQAEADLRVTQTEFDKQVEITKLLLEGIQTAHNNQMKCLRDFVEAQMSFFAMAHQHMADLQRELAGFGESCFVSGALTLPRPKKEPFSPRNGTASEQSDSAGSQRIALEDTGTKQARAILDYEPISLQELAIKQNDVLIVYRLPGLDADFVMAEKDGRRGRVPLSYLELI
ncbi:hypothetical protein QR680_017479 [Steinernema hermaphroditum]|uniref:SH3 domain-containing GRB2-like protein B1 n=1 Tax=Steinernema hermaphroditum TaxID=289476 RepID=A0AA39HER0_9BILA|nr:hypothetical protein QR680_017479 [Steinernema hermaphroditum]